MKEFNGRFLRKANNYSVSFSDGLLLIEGKEVIKKIGSRFVALEPKNAEKCGSLANANDKSLRHRMAKIAQLLSEGRQFEAVVIASPTYWAGNDDVAEATKANFNPAEPRQSGEWARFDASSGASTPCVDVQYRGYFHDFVVEDFLKGPPFIRIGGAQECPCSGT